MRKNQITMRYVQGVYFPALNVKVHSFPNSKKIAEHFKCSDKIAERAARFAFESAQESFWEYWQNADNLAHYFPRDNVKVWQDGRSGGWLYVEGLPDVHTWDAIRVAQWARFAKDVAADIDYRSGIQPMIENIEANRWAEEGAELYNFRDVGGKVVCVAEANRAAKEAYNRVMSGAE